MANFRPVSRAEFSARLPEQIIFKDVCDYMKRVSARAEISMNLGMCTSQVVHQKNM